MVPGPWMSHLLPKLNWSNFKFKYMGLFLKEHVYSAMIIISLIFNQELLNLRYYLLTKFYCVAFQVHPATAVSILKGPTLILSKKHRLLILSSKKHRLFKITMSCKNILDKKFFSGTSNDRLCSPLWLTKFWRFVLRHFANLPFRRSRRNYFRFELSWMTVVELN